MNREKLSQAIGEIDSRYVGEAMEAGAAAASRPEGRLRRLWRERRAAACVCMVLLAAAVTFSTAFAASTSFRQAVISVFYPRYSSSERKEIDEGHRTGSFDEEDTLYTFLDKFNNEKMEAGLTVKKDGGYKCTLLSDRSGTIKAIANCSRPDYKLLVTMERKPYQQTTGLWQVVSYQVISSEAAAKMASEMQPYVPGTAATK